MIEVDLFRRHLRHCRYSNLQIDNLGTREECSVRSFRGSTIKKQSAMRNRVVDKQTEIKDINKDKKKLLGYQQMSRHGNLGAEIVC